MSSDEEIVSLRKKKNIVVESDSSDENNRSNVQVSSPRIPSNDEDNKDENIFQKTKRKTKKKSRKVQTFDSSSDSENENKFQNNVPPKSVQEESKNKNVNVERFPDRFKNHADASASEEELLTVNEPATKKSWYKNSDVFDAESSDEELRLNKEIENIDDKMSDSEKQLGSNRNSDNSDSEGSRREICKKRGSSPQFPRKERKSKTKAQNEIQEIHKETQRMMREAQVSIPYHKPRQLTLAAFIERRKAIPSVSLHTTHEELSTAWKAIELREKEAELFYKSSSEEEEEGEENKNGYTDGKCEEDKFHPTENSNTSEKEDSFRNTSKSADTMVTEKSVEIGLVIEDQQKAGSQVSENSNNSRSKLMEPNLEDENNKFINSDMEFEKDIEITIGEIITEIDSNLLTERHCQKKCTGETGTNPSIDQQNIIKYMDNQISATPNTENCDDNTGMTYLSLSCPIDKEKEVGLKEETSDKVGTDTTILNTGNTEDYSLRFSETLTEQESFSKTVENNQTHSIPETENDDSFNSSNIKEDLPKQCETSPENIVSKTLESEYSKELTDKTIAQSSENDFDLSKDEEKRLNDTYNFKPNKTISNAPKIVDSASGIINFEEGSEKPGVNNLIERFYTHLSYKKKTKKKTSVELNIVSADTDTKGHVSGIFEETVQVLVGEDEEEEDPTLSKPGVRRGKLQAMLRAEMGRQREVEWNKRQQEQRLYEEEIFEGEKDVCDEDDNVDESEVDNDEGEDVSKKESSEEEEEEESEEDEEIEDNEFKWRKNKQKNKFVDDEAEESGDGGSEKEDDEESFIKRPKHQKVVLKRSGTADMFLSQEALKSSNTEDEDLPSFQKPQTLEENLEEIESSETSSVCPSPAFQLTALEGKDISNIYNWSAPPTPCKDSFNTRATTPISRIRGQLMDRSPLVATQDLEILCSGDFSSQPLQEIEENETQDFQLFLEDSQTSQVDTPIKSPQNIEKKGDDEKDAMRNLLVEDEDEMSACLVSKKVKKLNFSDDEEEGVDLNQVGEDSECENTEEKEELENKSEEEVQPDDVDYDSEENEVVKTAGDFLDKEAELSEEEWESEDEDEQGLDTLEMEEADRENINERKLQRQLGQMHIKQMLIEDKKEVRILQEMLLEDGELHSESKRQRLFRWSNNTVTDDEKRALIGSDDENGDDDEDEENWRKSRHEREQYLKEHSKKVEKLELAVEEHSDSMLLILGQKALKRMNSSNSQEPKLAAPVDPLASPNPKQPYKTSMTRGSFLTRGNQVLSRLAQMTAGSDGPIKQPKNNRNFLFTSVSPTKDQEETKPTVQSNNKRKKIELPLPMAKRSCVPISKTANKKSLFEALFKAKS